MDHFVRLAATDYASVMRPLEAGAGGLMISMVRGPAEVEQAVRWAKFWPRGERGLNGGNVDGRFGLMPLAEYTARANAETFLGIQIETAGALESRGRDRRHPGRRPAVRRAFRLEPDSRSDGRVRKPQVLESDRIDRPGLPAGRQAMGNLQPRARICRQDAKPGTASSLYWEPTSTRCTREFERQGALRRLLPHGVIAARPRIAGRKIKCVTVRRARDEFLAPVLLDRLQHAGRDTAVERRSVFFGNFGGDPAAGEVGGAAACPGPRRRHRARPTAAPVRDRARCTCERLESVRWRSGCRRRSPQALRAGRPAARWRRPGPPLDTRPLRRRSDRRGVCASASKQHRLGPRLAVLDSAGRARNPRAILLGIGGKEGDADHRPILPDQPVDFLGDVERLDQDGVGDLAVVSRCRRSSRLGSAALHGAAAASPAWGGAARRLGVRRLLPAARASWRVCRGAAGRLRHTRWRCWRCRTPCSRRPCTASHCDRSGCR